MLLLAALSAAAFARADELDALLSQPPSASLTGEDATRRIEMLRAFIASHPDRADEIEAYLIPFVRATRPPVAEPASTPKPAIAKPKPLLLIKSPDGTASTMRATSYRKQGAVIIATGANGSHAVLQTLTVKGELPWYSDEELASGAVDLKDLAGRYATFAMAMPDLRAPLEAESRRLNDMLRAREQAANQIRDAANARFAQVASAVYDPAAGYTPAALAKMLLEAEKARNELPGYAAKIDEWAAPFREHFAKLLSGRSFVNGAWVSNEDLARQAREKRQAEFLNGLDYQVGGEALPAGAVRGMFVIPLAEAGLLLIAGAGMLFLGRHRKYLRIAGIVPLALAPLVPASEFFLATRNPAQLPSSIPMADEQPIVDALSLAAGMDDGSAGARKISEDALNGFLARHVRLVRDAAGTGAVRESMAVRMQPGRIVVFEMIRDMGLNWIARIDLELADAEDGKPVAKLKGAAIGAMNCPAALASQLWGNLGPQLAGILAASRIPEHFSVRISADGIVELKPLDGAGTAAISGNP